ncbi:MAG: hypothetical protein K9M96_04665 [Deltaproteobacteria bacterium]|nr:hypothetical protein [Deltaproteobacteria bacterium]
MVDPIRGMVSPEDDGKEVVKGVHLKGLERLGLWSALPISLPVMDPAVKDTRQGYVDLTIRI